MVGAGNRALILWVVIMAKKEDLIAEMHRLESEIESYGTAVSDSQIWHKKARIEQIKKELAEMESPANKFNAGTEKLQEMMAQQQPQLTPEQIAALQGERG